MALTFALMFSAPLLRYGWTLLGNVWTETKELINLTVGILSPGVLLSSAVFYIRTRKERPQLPRKHISTTTIVGVLASFVIGTASLAAQISDTQWWRPVPLFWSSVPPLVAQHTAFIVLAIAATDDNSRIYWHTFVLGLFTLPLWAYLSFETYRLVLDSDSGSAWYAAAAGGLALSTFSSFMVNVYSTSYFADDRRHTTDSVKPKALM
ncbi:hypothetical protein PHSY_005387 [Pseudozyma hubeiensis SY62]|uniref:Uncharacterized protein n=1 Tax=Pseudozyma hubeiensis (strain SY62) TaxID=1305764 RepID=R9PI87_PSEHS|nr:hypothetical protein PHSY_005387 [Pseudozyma hubeiensis SY62]GAC97800.1 hypothetical protein PHSY_005387 [Pseudozyma hubeiensis SY62]